MPGEQRVLELREDRVLVAHDDGEQLLAGLDLGDRVAAQLLLHGDRGPSGVPELAEGGGRGCGAPSGDEVMGANLSPAPRACRRFGMARRPASGQHSRRAPALVRRHVLGPARVIGAHGRDRRLARAVSGAGDQVVSGEDGTTTTLARRASTRARAAALDRRRHGDRRAPRGRGARPAGGADPAHDQLRAGLRQRRRDHRRRGRREVEQPSSGTAAGRSSSRPDRALVLDPVDGRPRRRADARCALEGRRPRPARRRLPARHPGGRGRAGVATPRDAVDVRGRPKAAVRGPRRRRARARPTDQAHTFTGPGSVHLEGDLDVTSEQGAQRATSLDLSDGAVRAHVLTPPRRRLDGVRSGAEPAPRRPRLGDG